MKGVNIGGRNYNNLRYADDTADTALLAAIEKELSELISKTNEVGKQFGMKINIKKTRAMVVRNVTLHHVEHNMLPRIMWVEYVTL